MTPVWTWIYRAWLEAAADNQPTCYSSRIDGAVKPAYPRIWFGGTMTDTHETELELAGEMRPCTVHYQIDDGAAEVARVVMHYTERLHYNRRGEYVAQGVRYDVQVTNLLSKAQIKGLAAEITEALTDPEWDDAALLPLRRVTGMEEPA